MPTYQRPSRFQDSKLSIRLVPNPGRTATGKPVSITRRIFSTPQRLPISVREVEPSHVSFALTLPVPPSINHQYATVKGRRLLSSAGRNYKAQVGQLVWLSLAETPQRAALVSQLQASSLALTIRFYFSSALRRDVDGGLKIAQDALCEGLGVNDNRIVETHLYKHVDKANPRIEVSLATTTKL